MTRARNVLSRDQAQQMREWLEAERPALAKAGAKLQTVAILATKALGFPVTRSNISWMAEKHSLHWLSWQQNRRPKNAWKCPVCGGLMKKPGCSACDLTASQRKNAATAKRYGLTWFIKIYREGKYGSLWK